METMLNWLSAHADRIVLLAVVLVAALILAKVTSRLLRKFLERSNVPNASIFINLARLMIWLFAATIVLRPVFGINPTTLITALGVGGLALSLGLKDTIANVIGGFGLMLGKVVTPGDIVTVSGVTGTIKDITWRQTVVEERGGNDLIIPNSVLNTSLLERITPAAESCVTIPFTAKAGSDLSDISRRIAASVERATADATSPGTSAVVNFTGFTPYGVEGQVLLFAKPGVLLSTVRDKAVRALADAEFIEQRAAIGQ
ncbi:mechanosensitive ion channel family protein [Bifidobacterium tibiigranuli]|jgi:small-conductance mechanosensitive channel|uniref:mechanosensitive ion channel family protein n=1 Tax=Bifidobacterium tibiigranuli TaxID=2172043 RepID=UPI0026F0067F|nr:mechanosensitive ion channel domain-containing protein [Bifidobacterium tibiigranuli]MCI1649789.1 mechanosensitive ion channel family protein [Bifidobacterium tibiigranuli]MCI2186620.1 mechanosensitive ion channel family protein [Bifidobacterium tibiigranuli]MCI2204226.1 mechanosensitive ion channel family protein [Bifidobacterium tibiigranuli]